MSESKTNYSYKMLAKKLHQRRLKGSRYASAKNLLFVFTTKAMTHESSFQIDHIIEYIYVWLTITRCQFWQESHCRILNYFFSLVISWSWKIKVAKYFINELLLIHMNKDPKFILLEFIHVPNFNIIFLLWNRLSQ